MFFKKQFVADLDKDKYVGILKMNGEEIKVLMAEMKIELTKDGKKVTKRKFILVEA